MKRAFALTVLLLGVIAAMFLLREQAGRHVPKAKPDAGPTTATPTGAPGLNGPRVVALKRLLPRYALEVRGGDPTAARARFFELLATHGGRVLPADGGTTVAVPHAAWKPFLKALRGVDGGALPLRPIGERVMEGEAMIELEVSFSAP